MGQFSVKFWGVRGSIACGGPQVARYGGNTSCLEVRCGPRRFVFDAGSGIRCLGEELAEHPPVNIDLFLTHGHFDHVCGLPFFAPFFNPSTKARIWSGHLENGMTTREMICDLMRPPKFPVTPDIFRAQIEYKDFSAGDTIDCGDGVVLRTAPLNHQDGATGYRIEYEGHAICYVTDTEHVPGKPDENVLGLIDGADLVIYDSMFCDTKFQQSIGFGHSTWQEAVRLCEAAEVRRCVIFHHDPANDDEAMDMIARAASAMRPGTVVAREGMVLTP